jgi:hypothetical protein
VRKHLTRDDVLRIEDIFVTQYRDKRMPTGGLAELWFNVITTFLAYEGAEVIDGEVRDSEQFALETGQEAGYVAALEKVVDVPESSSEMAKLFFLITATNEDREEALKVLFR